MKEREKGHATHHNDGVASLAARSRQGTAHVTTNQEATCPFLSAGLLPVKASLIVSAVTAAPSAHR